MAGTDFWLLDLLLLAFLVVTAVAALAIRDLLTASIMLGAYSFLMCILWAQMGAVDVAFTEAAVGAGISTILFLATILRTQRRASD